MERERRGGRNGKTERKRRQEETEWRIILTRLQGIRQLSRNLVNWVLTFALRLSG